MMANLAHFQDKGTLFKRGLCAIGRLEPEDWMATLAGDQLISSISIPGSHDSCARYEPLTGTAQCQSLTLDDQLHVGVRFLDIRCRHIRDQFKIYHGIIDQKQSFDEVFSVCSRFLRNHDGETIIMSVQEEGAAVGNTRSFEQTFLSYLRFERNRWFLEAIIPRLSEVRGKIVLLRRFSAVELPLGIAATDWQDNSTFWIQPSIRVQDKYIVPRVNQKWDIVQLFCAETAAGHKGVLYINFTSGYRPDVFPDIRTVSNYINPRLERLLASPSRFGILVMDFVSAARCAALIIGGNGIKAQHAL
jgi:1-phosphatidylinositol phosphodiesterase